MFSRYDIDDCEVDSEGDDDEVNGNEDGDGDANEDDSEEGNCLLKRLFTRAY